MEYTKISQGYLCVPYTEIEKRYGKHQQIEDYDGWNIEINSLEICIAFFDFEDPECNEVFTIHSHHIDALELLVQEFGQEAISTYRPVSATSCGDIEEAA